MTGDDALLPYSSAFEAILYFYAAGALISYMLADHEITRDELFAVGATFTLVAWGFAYTFVVWQAIEPGSFIAAIDPGGERTWMELLFLSFTTLSSTGLSDVVPVRAVRAQPRDDRAARRRRLHRGRGLAAGRPHDPAAHELEDDAVVRDAARARRPRRAHRRIPRRPQGRLERDRSGVLVSNVSGAQPSPPPIALASASLRHQIRSSSV